jgi:hypothetical protein
MGHPFRKGGGWDAMVRRCWVVGSHSLVLIRIHGVACRSVEWEELGMPNI